MSDNQLMLGQSCWQDFMGVASDIAKRHKSHSKLIDPQAFEIFKSPLAHYFLSLGYGVALQMYLVGLGSPALNFDWLWLSV